MDEFVQFVKSYVKLIVAYPECVEAHFDEFKGDCCTILVFVDGSDIGRVIGKNANLVNALNSFVGIAHAKKKVALKLQVKDRKELS